jgi:large subunit ribosomal protein L6
MSRIGKKPITLPSGVSADLKGSMITVTGPKGSASWSHAAGVSVKVETGKAIVVTRESDASKHKALHGTTRALIQNMVTGVSQGYERKLEIYGTGYGCAVGGKTLDLNVGYSHAVKLEIPQGVKVAVEVAQTKGDETPAKLTITGTDKQTVGQFARSIKDARPPEPYKGKGVRYAGEQIKRKAGKAFAGAGG